MTTTTLSGRLLPFVLLTFGISWSCWMLAWLLGGSLADPTVFALFAAGGFGPSAAALVLRFAGRRSPRRCVVARASSWVPASLLLGVLPVLVAAGVGAALGVDALDATTLREDTQTLTALASFAATALLAGPLSEEFGWRGYAQPRLLARHRPAVTVTILGGIWAVWHVPLFWLDGTWQQTLGLLTLPGLAFLAGMIPLSSVYWFVSERLRGGVPAAVLLHLAANLGLGLLVVVDLRVGAAYLLTVAATALLLHDRPRHPGPSPRPDTPSCGNPPVRTHRRAGIPPSEL